MSKFLIDLPDPNDVGGVWVWVGEEFDTREDAVAWAKEHIGSDDEGKISLITELQDE